MMQYGNKRTNLSLPCKQDFRHSHHLVYLSTTKSYRSNILFYINLQKTINLVICDLQQFCWELHVYLCKHAVFLENLVLFTINSRVFLGGNWLLQSSRFLTKSMTFCSCRAISHALHGSVNQTVSVLPFGCRAYTLH